MFEDSFYSHHPIFSICADVNSLCKEFFSLLNFNFFAYVRYNEQESSFIGLVSNGDWLEHFFREKYTVGCTIKNSGTHLWESFRSLKMLEEISSWHNHNYGFSIFNREEGYIESFEFAAPSQNKNAISFYLNYPDMIKSFCRWFVKNSKELLKKVESNPIKIPEQMLGQINSNQEIEEIYQNFNKKFLKISLREQECLNQYLQGNTAKETAKILGLSFRTVEEYITNIKEKLGCTHKTDLLKIFNSSL